MGGWSEFFGLKSADRRREHSAGSRSDHPIDEGAARRASGAATASDRLAPARNAPDSGREALAAASTNRSGIVIGRYQGTVLVTVHGQLDLARAAHLEHLLADLIDGQGNLSLIVDLHDATATGVEPVSVLAVAAERARRRGGAMKVSKPPDVLHEALRRRDLAHLVVTHEQRRAAEDAPRRERRAHPAGRALPNPVRESHR